MNFPNATLEDYLAGRLAERLSAINFVLQPGVVYLMSFDGARPFKIGSTCDIKARSQQLKPREVLHLIPTDDQASVEYFLQQKYAACRIGRTEYFNLSPEQVAEIKAMQPVYGKAGRPRAA